MQRREAVRPELPWNAPQHAAESGLGSQDVRSPRLRTPVRKKHQPIDGVVAAQRFRKPARGLGGTALRFVVGDHHDLHGRTAST